MQRSSPQLTLGLALKDEATFANFFPGRNQQIINALAQTARAQGEHIIYLCGSSGSGLSHLLQATCLDASQHQLSSVYLPLANLIHHSPNVLEGLEKLQVICIDDIDVLKGAPEWEEAVFHLFNRIYDVQGKLVMAAHNLPKALELSLPDLTSRLSWGTVYQLHLLNDSEKLAALIMRADRRGIKLSEEVGRFILNHYPRHLDALFTGLEKLDKASLAAQRRLTIPFVKEVLGLKSF